MHAGDLHVSSRAELGESRTDIANQRGMPISGLLAPCCIFKTLAGFRHLFLGHKGLTPLSLMRRHVNWGLKLLKIL